MAAWYPFAWIAVLTIGATSACFSPSIDAVRCDESGLCPAGLACQPDGVCTPIGSGDTDGGSADADVDAGPITCDDWDAMLFDPCSLPAPGVFPDADDVSIDTDQATMSSGTLSSVIVTLEGDEALVVVFDNLTIASTQRLSASGSRPLILASQGAIAIAGSIDVSTGGAGAQSRAQCGASAGESSPGSPGAGGAGGLGGVGGPGGRSESGGGGADGGEAVASALLIGGCPGGESSSGSSGGGGAIWLSSAIAIDVNGNVNASGGGGFGGNGGGGGGSGGASGGMVVLEAPNVSVAGAVVANGGSGGGGGSQIGAGNDGAAGLLLPSQVVGGEGRGVGGDGGSGGAYAGPPTDGDSGNGPVAGGGGGGGGVGAIKVLGLFEGDGVVSPQPTP